MNLWIIMRIENHVAFTGKIFSHSKLGILKSILFKKNSRYIILVVIHIYRKIQYSEVHLKWGQNFPT